MVTEELLSKILRPQELGFSVTLPLKQELKFILFLPDLREAESRVWGDWGPTYNIVLTEDQPIRLSVQTAHLKIDGEVLLNVPELQYETPMLSVDREENPLFLTIPWEEEGLSFLIYFHPKGDVAKIELRSKTPWEMQIKVHYHA